MIFQFPDLETFRLAVTSAQVPPEVSAAPAEVAFDPEGRPSVRSAAGIPPKPMQNALRKLGVKQSKEHYSETILTVDCWPQAIPVSKGKADPEITSNTPVLFEMPSSEFAVVVAEMLRLGNDRQSFRTIVPATGQGERVLLKVIGPPYYTLLRAIDKQTQSGANVVAYLERSPRVWVEIGHEHPLATIVKPANGQVLLLRPERDWTVVADGAFQDIYDALDFQLPAAAVEWQQSQLKGKLAVPLRLAPGNAADVAELWVITEDAVDQLDSLVRDADERLMARLLFAVARNDEQTTIVLKTRPSRLEPPVLSLTSAQAFKPFWKLPNLFLPVGKRLNPTLRRDAVRRLLASDSSQVVWLMPATDGKFTPEILPDDAFRPLEDWIDYIIDHEHAPLSTWVQATRFDFDSFICPEDQPDKPKPPPPERTKKAKRPKSESSDIVDVSPVPSKTDRGKSQSTDDSEFGFTVEVVTPNEVKVKLRELEEEFVGLDGPLDSPDRQAIWARMAKLNTLDGRELEAAICWTNAFWELPDVPVEGAWAWLQSEDKRAKKIPTGSEFDASLDAGEQSPAVARMVAARVLYACTLNPVPESLLKRMPKIREYLEKHDAMLGVRAAWLAWWHLARVGGQTDVLALARVRDRLLQRLLAEGLNKERDLPYFLRTAGEQNSDRMRLIRDRAMKVHQLVTRWHSGEDVCVNRPYVDFMFAFAMAKLGEPSESRRLMDSATTQLLEPADPKQKPDPAHKFLAKAFRWRIENSLNGKQHAGPLPQEMLSELDKIDEGRGNTLGWRYPVDRMRETSWVLEPQDRTVAYARWLKHSEDLEKALKEIGDLTEPRRLETAIKNVLRGNLTAEQKLTAYWKIVPLSVRVGEQFSVAMLQQVPSVLEAANKISGPKEHLASLEERKRKLLERSLFLSGHYDRPDLVQTLFARFLDAVEKASADERHVIVKDIARDCLRSLRKTGLKEEIDRFLKQLTDLIIQGKSLTQLQMQPGTRWADALCSLLSLVEGWLFFGGVDRAMPFLNAARDTIRSNATAPKDKKIGHLQFPKVVRAYISALGQAPIDLALPRIEELFENMERLQNTFTTSRYYSVLHLGIVEEVIRSLINDNLAFGDQARRWLDDDEFLVRRRIHKNMKSLLMQSGI